MQTTESDLALSPPPRRPPVSAVVLLLYNMVYLVAFLFYLPMFGWRMLWDRSYRRGIRQRMGYVTRDSDGPVLWIHGVSVGEVKAAEPLVRALKQELPGVGIVVSSTTPTGAGLAKRIYPDEQVFYYPLDFGPFPGRALDNIRPIGVLLVELELWPNFLHAAEQRDVPVAVVNGRISKRSFKGYRMVRRLLPQHDRINLFCVQNQTYARRVEDLGVNPAKIKKTGNLKYDCLHVRKDPVVRDPGLVELLALEPDELVLVGGSTHDGEEATLGEIALALEPELGRPIRLVVAPRHPERVNAAGDGLRRVLKHHGSSRSVIRLTEQRKGGVAPGGAWLIVDTIGELDAVYSLADAVFVGGSLVRHGGQNMLEPVALGKPTLFGPHVWNFQTDVELLRAGDGVVQVQDADGLHRELRRLLSDESAARELARKGQEVVRANQGAVNRTLAGVLEILRRE